MLLVALLKMNNRLLESVFVLDNGIVLKRLNLNAQQHV